LKKDAYYTIAKTFLCFGYINTGFIKKKTLNKWKSVAVVLCLLNMYPYLLFFFLTASEYSNHVWTFACSVFDNLRFTSE